MGFTGEDIVLFNSSTMGYKVLNKNDFLMKQLNKDYKYLTSCSNDNLLSLVSKMQFPLANKEDMVKGILEGLHCQYLLNFNTSVFMTVATVNRTIEVVSRIDNVVKTLSAESYWMTWPESQSYNYGTIINCNAFEYVVQSGKTYKEAKEELFDFGNSGLSEVLERRMLLGLSDGIAESKELKGLCAYKYTGVENDIDVLEVEEGVSILEKQAFNEEMHIHRLILPSTLLFIQEGAINCRIDILDMSKTQVTKINNMLDASYKCGIYRLILPNTLVEIMGNFKADYASKCTYAVMPKSVRAIRNVNGLAYCLEKDSELEYLGSNSCDTGYIRNVSHGNKDLDYIYKVVKIENSSYRGIVLDTPNLSMIDSDATTKSSINTYYVLLNANLNNMSKGLLTRHLKMSSHFFVSKDSEAYNNLKENALVIGFNTEDFTVLK